ncbi:hypothetical protein Dimus_025503 [Dionaea muscipula]
MMMIRKPISALSVLFLLVLLLLLVNQIHGRKLGPEDYWKSVMADQAIPGAIKGMLKQSLHDDAGGAELSTLKHHQIFINKNFDTKRIAIIYHPTDENP